MNKWDHLKDFKVVRLNATVMRVRSFEEQLHRHYGLEPLRVEANTPEGQIPLLEDCDALFIISAPLPAAAVERLERCRLISRLGNGTDKIDVELATQRGIIVSNAPFFCVAEMADHIMAMLLSLARQLPRMDRHLRAGAYSVAREESLGLQRLSGRVLGIVGFGATGPEVAKRARAFGLRVLATRRNMNAPRRQADELGVEMVDLDTLLRQADFVSLQVPLTRETYHLIDRKALAKMKPEAVLINASRGALVDEEALVEALGAGRLAGAGLDTFEGIEIFVENPPPPAHPLVELENVILTPHVSGLSVQASQDCTRAGVENMVAVLSGHWPLPENIVNKGVKPWFPLKPYDPALFAESQCGGGEPFLTEESP